MPKKNPVFSFRAENYNFNRNRYYLLSNLFVVQLQTHPNTKHTRKKVAFVTFYEIINFINKLKN
jgi:hypothetical protein